MIYQMRTYEVPPGLPWLMREESVFLASAAPSLTKAQA
jgi:hypothetical protein